MGAMCGGPVDFTLGYAGYMAEKQEQMIDQFGLQKEYEIMLNNYTLQNIDSEKLAEQKFKASDVVHAILGRSSQANATFRLQASARVLMEDKSHDVRDALKKANLEPWTLMFSNNSYVKTPSVLNTFKSAFDAIGFSKDKNVTEYARKNLSGMFSVSNSKSLHRKMFLGTLGNQ